MLNASWRRPVTWIAAAISCFVLAYVAYAHALAWSHRMSPEAREFRDGFGERESLSSSWTVQTRGRLTQFIRAGVLTVNGSGTAGDEVVIASAPRKFDDGVITLRFRVPSEQAIETFLGLEEVTSGRTVKAAFVAGPTPFVHVGGDTSGPFRTGSAMEDVRVEAKPGEWHTLSLQFTPVYSSMTASLDGRPLASVKLGWFQGARARIIFGATLRGDAQNASVEMESISLDTLDWSAVRSFEESFSGEFLDVKRWMLQFPDPDFGKLDARIEKGSGLFLDGRMQSLVVDPSFVFLLRSVPFPLKSMHISAELWVDELEEASLFVGVMGASTWSPSERTFDVGITHRKSAALTYVGGGWTADGAVSFDRGEEITLPRKISVTLAYDASTSTGNATIGSKTSAQHILDLKPLDVVAMRVGAVAHSPGAKAKLHIRRVSVEMR